MGQQVSATVINASGQVASDLHLKFSGTGGNIFIDPPSVGVVPGGAPVPAVASNPPAVSNEADIDWNGPAVPPNATVNFVVTTRAGPLQFISGYWTGIGPNGGRIVLGPVNRDDILLKTLSDQFVPPVRVLNSIGESTPFVAARVVGSAILSGVQSDAAISRARLLDSAIEAAGLDTVTTDGIRRAVDEIGGNLQPPSLGRVGSILASNSSRTEFVPPTIEQVADEPIENPVERTGIGIVNILSNPVNLSDLDTPGLTSPLADLFANAVASTTSAAPAFSGVADLSGAFWHFARELQDGVRAADDPDRYIAWQGQFLRSIDQLIEVYDQYPSLVFARSPIVALQSTLNALDLSFPPDDRANFGWQIPILNALGSLPGNIDMSVPQTAAFARHMDGLRHDCPPCHDDCSVATVTLHMSGKLTNPHDCTTKDHTIKKVPLMHIWVRTCKWDAEVHYKRVYQCRKRWFDPVSASMCCWSIYEWVRKETWTYSQQKVTFSSTVPNDWDSEVTDIRYGDKKLAPPADANKTY